MNAIRSRVFLVGAALMAAAVALPATAQTPAPSPRDRAAASRRPLPYQSTDQSVGVVNCASGTVPWLGAAVQGVQRPADRVRDLVARRQARAGVPGAVQRPVAAHRAQPRHRRSDEGEGAASTATRTTCRRRSGASASGSTTACPARRATVPPAAGSRVHVEDGATHDKNVAGGLYDLADPAARARLCLSCHFGNGDRFVTHRLMGAGHPRMSFELDTFTSVEPAHFKPDASLPMGKSASGCGTASRVWAIGQAIAVAEMMTVLGDPKRSHDGLFPELVLFDCHACHHPMSDKRWAPRVPAIGPGVVRLNDSSMLMARQIAKVVDPPLRRARRPDDESAAAGGGRPRRRSRRQWRGPSRGKWMSSSTGCGRDHSPNPRCAPC